MQVGKEIFGYRCPTCKTINSVSVTYCANCGYWLLDTKYPAESINKDEYMNAVKEYAKRKRMKK